MTYIKLNWDSSIAMFETFNSVQKKKKKKKKKNSPSSF